MIDFTFLPLCINLILFIFTASAVWFAASRLSVYADIISDRTGLSKGFIGLTYF